MENVKTKTKHLEIKCHAKSYAESNVILRKVWTIFDNIYFKNTGCHNGWEYIPSEISENYFCIGFNNVSEDNYAMVNLNGGLEKLVFNIYEPYFDEVKSKLEKINLIKPHPVFLDFIFNNLTDFNMNEFVHNNVYIFEKEKKIHLSLKIEAFGFIDAKKTISDLTPLVSSIVFAYFHSNLKLEECAVLEFKSLANTNNADKTNVEWFDCDEIPVNNGFFKISNSFLAILDLVASSKLEKNKDLVRIVNSARNTKLANDMLRERNVPSDVQLYRSYIDGILMSALENLSTINVKREKCETCGQIKYLISSSVSDYCKENLNETVMQQASKMYKIRSKLFHENKIVIDEYCGISFPLLIEDKEKRDLNKDCYANDKKRNIFQQMFNGNVYNFVDYLLYLVRKELDKELK